MKKGFIFLLLVISFGVFGVGKVNADATLDTLNEKLDWNRGTYNSCIQNRVKLETNCAAQLTAFTTAYNNVLNYDGVSASLKDTMSMSLKTYTDCMDRNKQDISKCQNELNHLQNVNTAINNVEGTNNAPKDIYADCNNKTGAEASSCRANALALDCRNSNYGSNIPKACKTILEGQDNATKTLLNEQLIANKKNNPCGVSFIPGIDSFNLIDCADSLVTKFIQSTLIKYAQILLYFAAMTLNESIRFAIFDANGSVSHVITELYPVWQLIRQLVDYCVLFATLYLGAMYIMNIEAGKQFIEKHVPWLILFALFVNFSYPATKAMKDVSNIISLKIYASTVGGEVLNDRFGAGNIIMSSLGLPSLVGTVTDSGGTLGSSGADILKNTTSTIPSLLVFVMIMFIAFIFIIIAFLMIMSSIVCVFIITVSPILLIQKIIPKLDNLASKIREEFFNALALPVVFTLMFFLTTQVITKLAPSLPSSSGAGGPTLVVQIFNVVLMTISLWIMFKATKSVSGTFGKTVEEWGGKAAGLAMMATPAMAMRATAGRLGAGMLNSNTAIGGWIDKNRGTMLGDSFHKLGGGLATSTFDMRNAKGMRELGGMGGIKEMGTMGSKETFKNTLDTKGRKLAKNVGETKSEEGKERLLRNVGKYSLMSHEQDYLREQLNKNTNIVTGEKKRANYDKSSVGEQYKILSDDQEEAMKINKGIKDGKITTAEASNGPKTNSGYKMGNVVLPEDRKKEENQKEKLNKKIENISEEYKKAAGEDKQKIYEKHSNYSDSKDIHEALQNIDRNDTKNTFEYDNKNTFEGNIGTVHDEANKEHEERRREEVQNKYNELSGENKQTYHESLSPEDKEMLKSNDEEEAHNTTDSSWDMKQEAKHDYLSHLQKLHKENESVKKESEDFATKFVKGAPSERNSFEKAA